MTDRLLVVAAATVVCFHLLLAALVVADITLEHLNDRRDRRRQQRNP
jgi:hypothetical protein